MAEGLWISRFLKKSILIPWSEIECLDLGGLLKRDYGIIDTNLKDFLRTENDQRFFLIMSTNHKLLRDCYAGMKTWYAAPNVLGLTCISIESAEEIFPVLMKLAQEKKINLDTIVLGD